MYFPSLDPTTAKLVRFEMTPLQSKRFRLNRASGKDARWLRDVFAREGARLGTGVEPTGEDTLVLRWS